MPSTDYIDSAPSALRADLAALRAAPPVRVVTPSGWTGRNVDRHQPAWLFVDTQLLGDVLIEGLKSFPPPVEWASFTESVREYWIEHREQIATRADTLEVLAAGGYGGRLPDADAEFARRLAEARGCVRACR